MKNFWKRFKKYIILALIAGLLIWYFFPKEKKIEYLTETVQKQIVKQIVSVTGTVEADPTVMLRFQTGGEIASIPVKVGDSIKKGKLLAQLDSKTLQIQANQAKAGLDLAQANLALKKAGTTKEDIAVSQKQMESATVSYNAAVQTLEDVKKSAKVSEQKAQISLDNAQEQYKSALSSETTTTQTKQQAIDDAYKNAKTSVALSFVTAKEILSTSDSYLGIDQTSIIPNADIYLGVLNSLTKMDAERLYQTTKNDLASIQTQYNAIATTWKPQEVDNFLPLMLSVSQEAKELASGVYKALNSSITGTDFPQTTLDSYKTSISTKETTMSNNVNTLQTTIQAITNAKLGLTSSDISSSSGIQTAKSALDTAERSLEQTKIENQKAINAAQADVNFKKVAIDQAQAAYDFKIAVPRPVDLASLQAQVSQAQSVYQLALKNIENTKIIAPMNGVVTAVNKDEGENITSAEDMIVLMASDIKIIANISETDISKVNVGDTITMTLDAFSLDKVFEGKVADIDPAETVVQGVIYYKMTAFFDTKDPAIRSGMTVNLDILADQKENVLAVSAQAVQYKDNKAFVRVLENNIPKEKDVMVGLEGNQSIEITSGLSEGENVILSEK